MGRIFFFPHKGKRAHNRPWSTQISWGSIAVDRLDTPIYRIFVGFTNAFGELQSRTWKQQPSPSVHPLVSLVFSCSLSRAVGTTEEQNSHPGSQLIHEQSTPSKTVGRSLGANKWQNCWEVFKPQLNYSRSEAILHSGFPNRSICWSIQKRLRLHLDIGITALCLPGYDDSTAVLDSNIPLYMALAATLWNCSLLSGMTPHVTLNFIYTSGRCVASLEHATILYARVSVSPW